jgi:flagellar hook-basal body complex protein FliE
VPVLHAGDERLTQNTPGANGAANGKANMVDVVTAVAESEVAIDTLVSVRDKVISAYEEIMKMPI